MPLRTWSNAHDMPTHAATASSQCIALGDHEAGSTASMAGNHACPYSAATTAPDNANN